MSERMEKVAAEYMTRWAGEITPEHRLKLAASAIVAEWRTNGTADRDELRRNLVAALAEVEMPADKFRLLAQKFAEPMVHGGYTRTDTLTFTVDGLERFVAAVFAEGLV